ncbi:hypothetical protein BJ742DRAFT_328816 [Cladochytrium replicatum]|nr:hypothetical protein BJ742DRAFT_328816 [Cladochytrium replicatum]
MPWDHAQDSSIHQYAGAIVAEITVFICFLESYQRIQNQHLKISITLFMIFSVLVNVFFLAGTALVAQSDFASATPLFIIGSISWVLAWLNVTYHTSYRAALISLVGFQRPWIISIVAVCCQGALSGTGSVFFTMNFISSFGQTVDTRSTLITFVESFWYSIVETALFVVTQYRIVSVRSRIKKVSVTVKLQLYWKAVTRSMLYSLNVIMMFLAVGNEFGVNVGGNWSLYGHAITLLILMTDSNRFQETIAILNGDKVPNRGTGVLGTNTYGSTNGASGNHSFSNHNHSSSFSKSNQKAQKGFELQPTYPPSTRTGANLQHSNSSGSTFAIDTNKIFSTNGAPDQVYSPTRTNYSSTTLHNELSQPNSQIGYILQETQTNAMPYGFPPSQPNRNYAPGAQYSQTASSQFAGSQGGRY